MQGGKEKTGHKHHEELRRKVETLTGQMEDVQRENRDLKSEIDKIKWMEKSRDRAITKGDIDSAIAFAFMRLFSLIVERFLLNQLSRKKAHSRSISRHFRNMTHAQLKSK